MHLEGGRPPAGYDRHIGRKRLFLVALGALCALAFVLSISWGAVSIPPLEVVRALLGGEPVVEPGHQGRPTAGPARPAKVCSCWTYSSTDPARSATLTTVAPASAREASVRTTASGSAAG